MKSVKVKVRRRINRTSSNGKSYWKWYLEVPSRAVKELGLKIGTIVTVEKVKP